MSKTYEAWVASFVHRLSDYFNLGGWRFTIDYETEEDNKEEASVYASIHVNSIYMFANLSIYPQGKRDFGNGDMSPLISALVHELAHISIDRSGERRGGQEC